jgi:hypothetical protein
VVAHQQVFAQCLEDAWQAVGFQPQFARRIELVQRIDLGAADMAVSNQDECSLRIGINTNSAGWRCSTITSRCR